MAALPGFSLGKGSQGSRVLRTGCVQAGNKILLSVVSLHTFLLPIDNYIRPCQAARRRDSAPRIARPVSINSSSDGSGTFCTWAMRPSTLTST